MIKKVVIAVRYNSLTYLISEGFRNVLKNKKSSMTSLITMICAMFLFGAFFAMGENIDEILRQVQEEQGMQVFISDEATDEDIKTLKDEISALNGINTIVFKSKQEALDSMKESYKDNPDVFAGYEGDNNIFPASYIVTLTDLSLSEEVQNKIAEMDFVKRDENGKAQITSSNVTIDTLMRIARGINVAILVIFVLLLLIAVTIITNTIKLTVHARRKEISIMKYVGATNSFIRWPFMVEGMIIGIVSASITIAILALIYNYLTGQLASSEAFSRLGVSLLQFTDMAQTITIVFLALGMGIGIVGSRISMKKYLEV